ncbi:MAG: hypothetical protein H7831_18405 [Magnetococcus sp. WYHC-3]
MSLPPLLVQSQQQQLIDSNAWARLCAHVNRISNAIALPVQAFDIDAHLKMR